MSLMPASSSASPIARDKRVIARQVAGETLLVPTRPGAADFNRIFLLNEVGAFVWKQLAQPRHRDELVAMVRDEFAAPDGHDIATDVDNFLAELDHRGLLADAETKTS